MPAPDPHPGAPEPASAPRRSWRPRITLGWLMIVVLIVGIPIGLVGRARLREARVRSAMARLSAQHDLTQDVLQARRVAIQARVTDANGMSAGSSAGPGGWDFHLELRGREGEREVLLAVGASCRLDDDRLPPIRVEDRGGTFNAEAIAALTRAYRDQGWRYEVVETAGDGPQGGAGPSRTP